MPNITQEDQKNLNANYPSEYTGPQIDAALSTIRKISNQDGLQTKVSVRSGYSIPLSAFNGQLKPDSKNGGYMCTLRLKGTYVSKKPPEVLLFPGKANKPIIKNCMYYYVYNGKVEEGEDSGYWATLVLHTNVEFTNHEDFDNEEGYFLIKNPGMIHNRKTAPIVLFEGTDVVVYKNGSDATGFSITYDNEEGEQEPLVTRYFDRLSNGEICFTAQTEDSTIELIKIGSPNIANTAYSTDGVTWTSFTPSATEGSNIITLADIGDKVYFRNDILGNFSSSNHLQFKMSGEISANGNVNSLYSATNYQSLTALSYKYCYYYLFYECSSLTAAPWLPAVTLSTSCYEGMFNSCDNLVVLRPMKATTYADRCFFGMFSNCTSLKQMYRLVGKNYPSECCNLMYSDLFDSMGVYTTARGVYTTPFRIPNNDVGTAASGALSEMFMGTATDLVQGTPSINSVYYTNAKIISPN